MKLDIAAIKARADKATAGPWESDATQNEGDYGSGPDCGSGFSSYEVAAEKGRICDTINSDVAMVCEEYDEDGSTAFDEVGQANMDFIAHARTDIPDLIASLEAAERERDDAQKALRTVQNAAKTLAHSRDSELQHLRENSAYDHKLRAEHDSLIERDALMTARVTALEQERDSYRAKLMQLADATEVSGLSWSGFNILGDDKSIDAVQSAIHYGGQIDEYRAAFLQRKAALEAERDEAITEADKAATERERERCAKIADDKLTGEGQNVLAAYVTKAIRGEGQ